MVFSPKLYSIVHTYLFFILLLQVAAFSPSCSSVQSRRNVSDLKSVLAEKIPEKQEEVKAFRKQHGNTKVGEITVDMVRNNFSTFILHNRDLLLLIPKKLRSCNIKL